MQESPGNKNYMYIGNVAITGLSKDSVPHLAQFHFNLITWRREFLESAATELKIPIRCTATWEHFYHNVVLTTSFSQRHHNTVFLTYSPSQRYDIRVFFIYVLCLDRRNFDNFWSIKQTLHVLNISSFTVWSFITSGQRLHIQVRSKCCISHISL